MVEGRFGDEFRAELLDLLLWRRDVRRFKSDALPEGTLERLVGLACLRTLGWIEPAVALRVGRKLRTAQRDTGQF